MELSLEEVLDIVLEIISGTIVVVMMLFFRNAQSVTTILERMI